MQFIENKRLQEGYYKETLHNGLTVFVYPMKHKTTVYAMLSARVGSSTLDFVVDGKNVHVPEGTAHFLEHKMFENESGVDAFELFAKTGASANAYTSFDKTCYLFEASLNAEESLKTIIQFVGDPYFTKETVEKEQGIIGQEIKMYLDHPGWRQMFGLLELLYHNNPVRHDIAGSVESIAELTPDLLYDFYNAFYNPTNMVLAVAGNISPEAVFEICEEVFSKKDWTRHETTVIPNAEPDTIVGTRKTEKMSIFSPQFSFGFKEIPFSKEERVKNELVLDMLLYIICGDTSDLYRRLYDEGLINGGISGEALSGDDYLATMFSGESEDPERAVEAIEKEIQRFKREGIDDARFEECRRAFLGDTLTDFEDPSAVATNLTYSHFKRSDIYAMIALAETVTKDDLLAMLKSTMREDHSAVMVIEPTE